MYTIYNIFCLLRCAYHDHPIITSFCLQCSLCFKCSMTKEAAFLLNTQTGCEVTYFTIRKDKPQPIKCRLLKTNNFASLKDRIIYHVYVSLYV